MAKKKAAKKKPNGQAGARRITKSTAKAAGAARGKGRAAKTGPPGSPRKAAPAKQAARSKPPARATDPRRQSGKTAGALFLTDEAERRSRPPQQPPLDRGLLAASIREGKQRRHRRQPRAIEDLAIALVQLGGAAEMLALTAADWRSVPVARLAAPLPPVDEFLQKRRRSGEAKGGVWTLVS